MSFTEVEPASLDLNPFASIGKEWMLLTAGADVGHCNTMTASWGGLGVVWGKDVATVYVRPQRYTKEFLDAQGRFTLSFFGVGNERDALWLLGRVSGRDEPDKIARSGLVPVELEGSVAFEQARLVFVCRTLYTDLIDPARFVDESCDAANYPEHDYHTLYIAEVEHAFVNEQTLRQPCASGA